MKIEPGMRVEHVLTEGRIRGEVLSVRSARRSPRATCEASTRSLHTRLAPNRFISARKQTLLCSSNGARVKGCATHTGPILIAA